MNTSGRRFASTLAEERAAAIAAEDDLEIDMCGDLWADILQDIVRRAGTLDHLNATMAFTCSQMRPDGFGGLAMLITAAEIRSASTHTLLDMFYAEAREQGEIGHGDS